MVQPLPAADVDGVKFLGDETDRNVGIFVGGDGDFNADGVDDLVIAAWKTEARSDGRVYVVYGGQPIDPDFRLGDLLGGDGTLGIALHPDDERTRDRFGRSADFIGDVNGDGVDDLIVGSIYSGRTEINDLPYDAGEAYVIYGRPGGLPNNFSVGALLAQNGGDGSQGFVIRGFRRQDELGRSVSRAGDLNGDGLADLVVGALVDTYIYDDPTPGDGPGEAYVIFGRPDGGFPAEIEVEALVNEGDGSEGFVVRGVKNLDRMGVVAEAGDVDGDGIDDLVLGALSGGRGVSGEVYVIYGRSDPFPSILELASLLPSNGGNGSQGFVVVGATPGDRLGLVHGAGDINGDGFDDVLMGAYRAEPFGLIESGAVYAIFGTPRTVRGPAFDLRSLFPANGGDGSRGFIVPGSDAGDRLASVSTAGNVNGDAFDDIIVGSFRGEEGGGGNNTSDVGEAYLILGRAIFPPVFVLDTLRPEFAADGSSGAVITGEDAGGRQGRALSTAGDIDGDGYDDVVTGAWQADGEGNGRDSDDAGEAYLTYGRPGLQPSTLKVAVYDNPFPNPVVGACAGSAVELFDDTNFADSLGTLPVAVYESLPEDQNNRISAIAVPAGLRVLLFRGNDVSLGADLIVTEDTVLAGGDDNAISALVVECIDPLGAPELLNPGDQRNGVGDRVSVAIAVANTEQGPFTFTATGLPPITGINPVTGVIGGRVSTPGVYPVTVMASNRYGGMGEVSFTWAVADLADNVPPTLMDPGPQTDFVDAEVALQLQGEDVDGDALTYAAAPLPDGLTLDPATGLISGRPTPEQTLTVSATATDPGGASAAVTFSWDVALEPNVPPMLEQPPDQRTVVDEPTSLQLIASDGNGDELTFAAAGLPDGLTIDPATGLISGTPITVGEFTVTASVVDTRDGRDEVTFPWRVLDDEVLIETSFDQDSDGFTYIDDAFRGTDEPIYADGSYGNDKGFEGGGLEVLTGGVDDDDITGMSGAWTRAFTLVEPALVSLTLRYELDHAASHESDEVVQALASIDGVLLGTGGSDAIAELVGVNGSPDDGVVSTGWQVFSATVSLPAGEHVLTLGSFHSKKTVDDEVSRVRYDDVSLTIVPVIVDARFDDDSDGFAYADDAFRNTSAPAYANGAYESGGGFEGGGLSVTTGGIDDDDISGMSGAWSRSFSLSEASTVTLSLRYELVLSGQHESDEFAQVLASIDGALIGRDGGEVIDELAGPDDDDSPNLSTGWQTFSATVSLAAGEHTLAVGGFHNEKTFADEDAIVRIDEVLIALE
ncbi:MAG: putative Ig domain-containing protein [Pseudomonadota bacterium]